MQVPAISQGRRLYEVRDQLSPWAQALLALTLEQLSPGELGSQRTLFFDLESTALRTASGVHWEEKTPGWQNMTTPLSTSAMVVYALLSAIRHSVNGRCCALSHAAARTGRVPDSSYATAWSLMALSQVIKGTGELSGSYDFSATLNSLPIASGQAGLEAGPVQASSPIDQLYPHDPNAVGYPSAAKVADAYITR